MHIHLFLWMLLLLLMSYILLNLCLPTLNFTKWKMGKNMKTIQQKSKWGSSFYSHMYLRLLFAFVRKIMSFVLLRKKDMRKAIPRQKDLNNVFYFVVRAINYMFFLSVLALVFFDLIGVEFRIKNECCREREMWFLISTRPVLLFYSHYLTV